VVAGAPTSREAYFGKVADRDIRPASRSLAALAAVIAILATIIVTVVPGFDSVQSSAPASAAMDTLETIALGLTAAIVAGRARRSSSRSDLLLADGLVMLAVGTLFLSLIPDLSRTPVRTYATWSASATRLAAVALFVAGAVARNAPLEHPAREVRRGLAGALIVTAIVAAVMAPLANHLPELQRLPNAGTVSRDILSGPRSLLLVESMLGIGLLVASIGFAKRSAEFQDALLGWVAAGLSLAAFSRFGYALFPSQSGDYIYLGDFLGLAACLVLLAGAGLEVLSAQAALAEAAIRDERRRLARDLHDGLAQELAFITAQTRRLAVPDAESAEALRAAAERALEESRLAIAGLIRRGEQSLEKTLHDAATSTASRAGVEVAFDLEPGVAISAEAQQALLRVQAQAIVNAAVHGHARRVRISLRSLPQVRLSITDDGDGFDVTAPRRPDSIGLDSIRERAEALGGHLSISSAVGAGTTVEVLLP
jgi:signal transduction histidine kinase